MHHGDSSMVMCDSGFQVSDPTFGSMYGQACRSTFHVRCVEGNMSYSYDGAVWETAPIVCVRHCGTVEDVCGAESCSVNVINAPWNAVDNADTPMEGRISHGESQSVECLPGYRVADKGSLSTSCDHSQNFTRDCQNCFLEDTRTCLPVRCPG
eukprot:106255-Rhodomonas_salina.1